MEGAEKSESNYYSAIMIHSLVTHHIEAMEKVGEQHILTKCSKCNTFQVINDILHEIMNFNTLKTRPSASEN